MTGSEGALCAFVTQAVSARSSDISETLEALVESLVALQRHKPLAVLCYGSCLRGADLFTNVVDLHLIFADYKDAAGGWMRRLGSHLLPPVVCYHEAALAGGRVRCKYGSLSLRDLEAGCADCFHSYIYGRMAQPVALIGCADEAARGRVLNALTMAVRHLLRETLPLMREPVEPLGLWEEALRLSYGCELRAESADRGRVLIAADQDYYRESAARFLEERCAAGSLRPEGEAWMFQGNPYRRRQRLRWRIRRYQGKLLSLLRLMLCFFTFERGIDYIVFKLERHSGQSIDVPNRVRRWPLIFLWEFAWRLYRRGIFR